MDYKELIERLRKAIISPFDLGPVADAIESLLTENERLKDELAKYRAAPVVAWVFYPKGVGEKYVTYTNPASLDLGKQADRIAYIEPLIVKPVDVEPTAYLSIDCIGERYLCFSKPADNDSCYPLYTNQPVSIRIAELELEVVRLRSVMADVIKAHGYAGGTPIEVMSTPFTPTALPELVEKVEKMTIERCAAECDYVSKNARPSTVSYAYKTGADECAAAIRKLGEQ